MKRHLDGDGFQLELETHRHHLRGYVHGGEDSFQVSLSYWMLLAEACKQFGKRRLLVVEDLAPWHAAEEDFQRLMEAMRRSGWASAARPTASAERAQNLPLTLNWKIGPMRRSRSSK